MSASWIIGRGGLLGSALERALRAGGRRLFVPDAPFPWHRPELLAGAIQHEVGRYAAAIAAHADPAWQICWAAGVGTMSSPDEAMQLETQALGTMLHAIAASTLDLRGGRIAIASSAGAIYAGSRVAVISEATPDAPTTPYARAKLAQEALVRAFAARYGVSALIARISTLYGVGQANGKQQGLLTHISRCMVRNTPIHIYVPLDTIRDYISADDAAVTMLDCLKAVPAHETMLKVIASEQPATISQIVGTFKRFARRPPRIITGAAAASAVYTHRIQFASVVPPAPRREPTPLHVGISRLLAAERTRYAAGERGTAAR